MSMSFERHVHKRGSQGVCGALSLRSPVAGWKVAWPHLDGSNDKRLVDDRAPWVVAAPPAAVVLRVAHTACPMDNHRSPIPRMRMPRPTWSNHLERSRNTAFKSFDSCFNDVPFWFLGRVPIVIFVAPGYARSIPTLYETVPEFALRVSLRKIFF